MEIYELEEGREYISKRSGHLSKVLHLGRHAQNCEIAMVMYVTINATQDAPPGQVWMCEESMYMKVWREKEDGE